MKIALRHEEYEFLITMLRFVDGRAYDPIYKNIANRIEQTSYREGIDNVVTLEESEIYSTLDALNEFVEEATNGNYTDPNRKARLEKASNMANLIGEETGLRI